MKYVIAKISGSQHKVSEGQSLEVTGFLGEKGKTLQFDEILLSVEDAKVNIGNPFLKGVDIKAEVVDQKLGEKLHISKFKAKTGYRRKMGFRPQKTVLMIKKINFGK